MRRAAAAVPAAIPAAARCSSAGITLVDVLVVLVLIGLLVALWVPMITRTNERARRFRCQNNLQVINNALTNYRNLGHGWPRVTYVPGAKPDVSGGGSDAPDPFKAGGPPANNVPAALFLLVRTQELNPAFLVCPAAATGRYAPDRLAFGEDGAAARSNFTDVKTNLGYSFFVTYSEWGDKSAGSTIGQAVVADLNPGTSTQPSATPARGAGKAVASPQVSVEEYRRQNSNNHAKRGQMVLFDNGSVEWYVTPFAGFNADNIYSTQKGTIVDTPAREEDAILLPTD
jgi:type II secretory pathway pseudopilin PulG